MPTLLCIVVYLQHLACGQAADCTALPERVQLSAF